MNRLNLSVCLEELAHAEALVSTPSRSGVFSQATNRLLEQFTESISFDHRLYSQDIAGSIAHSRMLAETGIITGNEQQQIERGLLEIREEIESGRFELRSDLEDIHMHIERALIDRLSDVGRKLHSGRSRNDQVATDFRLWVRDALDELDGRLRELQRAFVGRCDRDADVILPAYTHLQRAQPVLAAHYWLAYCEKFERDRLRLHDCRRRVNVSPLGTAAVAGTSLPIDRQSVARQLGFEAISANSLDSSSDRDFVLETAFVLALIAEHLSTLAEEWILWSTAEFNFIRLPQEFCTGSSIMPQKINPDVMELVRGKTARVIGNLQALLVLVKGLPLAYNRDLQEDKPPLFDSVDTVKACVEIVTPIVRDAQLNHESIAARLERGHLDATTFMEHLIQRGMPQRTAHHLVGELVRKAIDRGVALAELPLSEFQKAHPDLDASVFDVLGVKNAIRAFVSYGSTAATEVAQQVQRWRSKLEQDN